MYMRRLGTHQRDLLIASGMVTLVFIVSAWLDLAERFIAWTAPLEHSEIDELPQVLLAIAIAAIWFSGRRMRELAAEIRMRIQAETRSRDSLALYKTLFEEGLSGNFIASADGHVRLCNEAFRVMSGMSSNRQLRFNLAVALGDQWLALLDQLHTGVSLDFHELSLRRMDQAPWVVMARFRLSSISAGQGHEIHGYFTDITEQHLAEKELARLLVDNRALSHHAMQVQEEERCHLAREIHDDLGQYLTAIRLDAAALPLRDQDSALAIHAARIVSHAEHIQTAVKRIIKRLRPAALDAHGLIEAIRCLVSEWARQNPRVHLNLNLDERCSRLPDFVSIIAYRMVQEALTNVARHADATLVNVLVHRLSNSAGTSIQIEIRDNGVGFDTRSHYASFGLTGMRERVESIQGSFQLVSSAGAGVLVSAALPLQLATGTKRVKTIAGG